MPNLSAKTLSGAETRIDRQAIDEFAATLGAAPILPDAPDYEARAVFNAMIDKRPTLIVRCGGVADVTRSVRFAGSMTCSWRFAAALTTSRDSRPATVAS